ncbi:MAG: aminotransferase class V-fold PLP-dependent enzyme [Saprospiraceae bacterium]|nr:aminotransferase class V-fold PLP-dependent enzyme [Saprospiraceae bacterium]
MELSLEMLEQESRKLDFNSTQRSELLKAVIHYSEEFLDHIEEIPVYQESPEALERLAELTFEEQARPIEDLLKYIGTAVDNTGINPAGSGHMGYVPGGGTFPTALGDFLAAITNRYAGIYYANPGAVMIEDQCIRWMAKLVGYPDLHAGNLSSGGSIATLTAITAARNFHKITPENVRNQVIYHTQQTHHCVLKAVRMAALDFAHIRRIPMNDEYQMDVAALAHQLDADLSQGLTPFLIVASAGTTDTGIIDPLEQIAALATRYNCWFHIDAAYGGFFALVPALKDRLSGLSKSDSIVLDPHKGLFLSYGTGAVLIKNRSAALQSQFYRANYMQDADGEHIILNPSDVSPELTKHFRGLRMWLSLHLTGIKPYRAALEEKLRLAQYFHASVSKLGYEVGPKPTLTVCLFRQSVGNLEGDNEINRRILNTILKSGKVFLSSTTLDGVFWLRICVMVFRTHKKNIDDLLDILQMNEQRIG